MKKIILLLIISLAGTLSCGELFSTTYNVRFEVTSATSGAKADIDWDIISDYESDDAVLPDTTLPWSHEKSIEVGKDGGQAFITLTATNRSTSAANIRVSIYVDDVLKGNKQGDTNIGSSQSASYSIYEY